jgi:hypothetical protein
VLVGFCCSGLGGERDAGLWVDSGIKTRRGCWWIAALSLAPELCVGNFGAALRRVRKFETLRVRFVVCSLSLGLLLTTLLLISYSLQ